MMVGGDDLFSRPTASIRLSDEQRIDWLRLMRSENVGPKLFQSLINSYGGAKAALAALPDLSRKGGLRRPITIASREEAVKELELAARSNASIIGFGESAYPVALRMSATMPPMITVRGNLDLLKKTVVSIVGSRNCSAVGLKMAAMLARDLGQLGYAICSGLARGIDKVAHEASRKSGTIMVLAGGHDRIYPPEHAPLVQDYLNDGGVAITEMPFGYEPKAQDFPRRNRIIAGLCAGLVVVEAAERSGSLITARLALEDNREVFAVPGSPLDPRAFGPNALIKQGACLTRNAEDVHEVLSGQMQHDYRLAEAVEVLPPQEPDDSDRAKIVTLLGPTPVSLDDLVSLSNVPVGAVRVVLFELELAGRVHATPDGLFQLL